MKTSRLLRSTILILLGAAAAADSSSITPLRRSLTKTSSNINDTYAKNSERHQFRNALFGSIAAVGTLVGLLFLVDRELFNSKCACLSEFKAIKYKLNFSCESDAENDIAEDQYVNYESATKQISVNKNNPEPKEKSWFESACVKPQISRDEIEVDEAYISAETKQYLTEQREATKLWKSVHKLLPLPWKTKECDDSNNYNTKNSYPNEITEVSEDEQTIVSVLSHQMEEVRLRLFWKPTKDYDENNKGDKYAITVKDSDEEVVPPVVTSPYANVNIVPVCPWEQTEEIEAKTSSYESADETVVPYA